MASKLIELEEGILVEVEVADDQVQKCAGGAADRVDQAMESIKPLIRKACQPVIEVWDELNQGLTISEAQIELGLGFAAEGGVFIAKGSASANLTITLTIVPKHS